MSQPSPYRDIRSELFRSFYEKGLPYEEYVATGKPTHQERWREALSNVTLNESQRQLLRSFRRKMNVLVMSGTWCGDCSRQSGMWRRIEEATDSVEFRYLDNHDNPELQNELRINGAEKVPVVVILSEDFFEISRFGDKHLSYYRLKASRELGPSCEIGILPPAKEELETELSEWIDHFERAQIILRLSPMLRQRYQD